MLAFYLLVIQEEKETNRIFYLSRIFFFLLFIISREDAEVMSKTVKHCTFHSMVPMFIVKL